MAKAPPKTEPKGKVADTEVISLGKLDISKTKRKIRPVTRHGIVTQLRNLKKADGTEQEWGSEARQRLISKADSIGITVEGL